MIATESIAKTFIVDAAIIPRDSIDEAATSFDEEIADIMHCILGGGVDECQVQEFGYGLFW